MVSGKPQSPISQQTIVILVASLRSEDLVEGLVHDGRAIYAVDVQFNQSKQNAKIQGFSFAPADCLNYDEAFQALFFDEVNNLLTI